ncbi:hypothetical protein KCP69_19120 [Salmonella enterica subsp. enterica]|nr:hypothetical protein KCP69_19120 [Salmonella enterica subsp. enterica]
MLLIIFSLGRKTLSMAFFWRARAIFSCSVAIFSSSVSSRPISSIRSHAHFAVSPTAFHASRSSPDIMRRPPVYSSLLRIRGHGNFRSITFFLLTEHPDLSGLGGRSENAVPVQFFRRSPDHPAAV